ncbi:hypothetical protein JEU11_04970 [Paraglaciecola chathamensis]|uniref:DRBM domain-containing protein n=1 Tax=Paraglaciecola chathamensis TaxID=368405 RepID=A0ABS0WBH7_9ALTE|nr:hypothetical protein [Paraglaciecola chathamensis]MBJ2135800.1 hypothetical protein [Paraglaciecola chathamensis]
MNEKEFEFEIIPSPHDREVSVCVGVRVLHKSTNLAAESTTQKTQYANKMAAIETLKELLVKERFLNIDETDLIEGNAFFNSMD